MARVNIDQVRQLGDFVQSIRWKIEFPKGIPGGGASSQGLDLRCTTVTPPSQTGEPMEINIRQNKVPAPGVYPFNMEFNTTFVETIDMYIHKMLKAWMNLCWEVKTGKQSYYRDLYTIVNLYRMDGQDKIIWKYSIYDVYPKGGEMGELSSDNSPVNPNISWAYTYYETSGG